MSKIDTPQSGYLDKKLSTDQLEETFDPTEKIILKIKTACTLAMRTMVALNNNSAFQTDVLRHNRNVHHAQLKNFDEQLKQEKIRKKLLKRELGRKIELLSAAIELHENAFLVRDLKRARRMLKRALDDL